MKEISNKALQRKRKRLNIQPNNKEYPMTK
jgi:hypothetical protein